MKAGFVALLGRPNAGKSTLLNAILSKKVSIVSPRSQTTREDVIGIYNEKDLQIVYVDTPGLFEGQEALYQVMYRAARRSLSDIDAMCYLVDCSSKEFEKDDAFLKSIKTDKPRFLLLNKIDLCTLPEMEETKKHFAATFPEYQQIEISALKNFGLKDIKEKLEEILPENPPFYPETIITDKDRPFQAKEIVRESLLHFVKDEIPHDCAVVIDEFNESEKDKSCLIRATIYCSKDNQKAILVGRKGDMIKKISMRSRKTLEKMWKMNVSLYCQVEVLSNWRNDPRKLQKVGYGAKERN